MGDGYCQASKLQAIFIVETTVEREVWPLHCHFSWPVQPRQFSVLGHFKSLTLL